MHLDDAVDLLSGEQFVVENFLNLVDFHLDVFVFTLEVILRLLGSHFHEETRPDVDKNVVGIRQAARHVHGRRERHEQQSCLDSLSADVRRPTWIHRSLLVRTADVEWMIVTFQCPIEVECGLVRFAPCSGRLAVDR